VSDGGTFVSRAGFSPGQLDGGRAHPPPIPKGSQTLRAALVEAAQAAAKYLAAVVPRLAARRGRAAYHIVRRVDTVYQELGWH
jgi:hypothetical protein